jgi:hypothetical protein
MIVALDAPSEGDPGAVWHQHLRVDTPARIDELTAVDHGCGQCAMVHDRAGTRPPHLPSVNTVKLGSTVTQELEAVAALDQDEPLGDQALELERAHFGTVLLALAFPLRGLIGIEVALDLFDAAVKDVDERPEQRLQIRFETGVGERCDHCIKHVGKRTLQPGRLGQRARIALIVMGAVDAEGELVKEMGGRGQGLAHHRR